jgi:hypothetical protein
MIFECFGNSRFDPVEALGEFSSSKRPAPSGQIKSGRRAGSKNGEKASSADSTDQGVGDPSATTGEAPMEGEGHGKERRVGNFGFVGHLDDSPVVVTRPSVDSLPPE